MIWIDVAGSGGGAINFPRRRRASERRDGDRELIQGNFQFKVLDFREKEYL